MLNQGSKLKTLNIIFGGACNQKCSYCLQAPDTFNKKGDPEVFIEKFKRLALDKNITNIERINYWGGEPLLYMSAIEKTYNGLKELFSKATHRITTNGTLIDESYVEFCNKDSNIITVVSLHEYELTEKQWKLIGKINRLYLSGLIHHKKHHLGSYLYRWNDITKIVGRPLPLALNPTYSTSGCDSSYWLTKEDVDVFFDEVEYIGTTLGYFGLPFYQNVVRSLFYSASKDDLDPERSRCFNASILSIDLFGNQFRCHHNNQISNRIGNVFTNTFYAVNRSENEGCKDCECISICKGGCEMSSQREIECHWYKRKWRVYQLIKGSLKT